MANSEHVIGTASVLMSGGIDSAACAHLLVQQGQRVRAFFVDYQQAAIELERQAATKVCERLHVPLTILTAKPACSFGAGELLGRNAFLVLSTMFLGGCRDGSLSIGIHTGTPYYDCSPAFLRSISTLVAEHTDGRLVVSAPFIGWTKAEISTTSLPLGCLWKRPTVARRVRSRHAADVIRVSTGERSDASATTLTPDKEDRD